MRTRRHLLLLVILLLLLGGCSPSVEPTATGVATPSPVTSPAPATAKPVAPTETAPSEATSTSPPPTQTPTPSPTESAGQGRVGVIAFYSERDGNAEIYVMNADGSGQQRLTNDSADDVCPDWSPDGTRLVFISARHDPNPTDCSPECAYEIYTMNADGSEQQRLTDTSATELHPVWSPDGSQIAFASGRDGNNEIYIINADGGNPRRLTDTPAAEMHPTWSPDGSQIAFNSDRDGNWEIYAMKADGSDQRRLTDDPAWDLFPVWSPDGSQIAYFSMVRGSRKQDIYVMNTDGNEVRQLTDRPASVDEDPGWSPDGTEIVFQSDRDGDFEIYVMNADGSDQRPLSNARSDEYWPAWRPDPMAAPQQVVPTPLAVETRQPTPTPVPAPPPLSLPPTPETAASTHTVCAQGCDFPSLQAAIDDPEIPAGAVLELRDPVHTEAGIVISKDLTIRGPADATTIVQAHEAAGEASQRVFTVKRKTTVLLAGLTIRHGNATVPDDQGGGIYNYGTLTLYRCTVASNRANGGGGIANSGQLALIESTVAGNTAHGEAALGDECGNGGGIKCGNGELVLLNSTVSGNKAGNKGRNRGGGIFVGCGCTANLVNSTVSGNQALHTKGRSFSGGQGVGGGIYVKGTLEMVHCTVSENRSSSDNGGLYVAGELDVWNSIVARNRGLGEQCLVANAGTMGTSSNNLSEDGSCDPLVSGDAQLGPLSENGGPTLTHALLAGSPAIDAIPVSHCPLPTDQRGAQRPEPPTSVDTPCDIGAFELQASEPTGTATF